MGLTKEFLQMQSQKDLVELVLKLQEELSVVESWRKHHAEREVALFEKLHGIELSKD